MDRNIHLFVRYLLCIIYSIAVSVRLLFFAFQYGINTFKVNPRISPPYILRNPKWGKNCFIKLKKQGIKLHYVEKGNRNHPLMLLLHGFPECWLSWRHQLEEFSSKYWVVAVDLRGFGESDKPKGKENYKVEIVVEDIKELIESLGKPRTVLVGHDWGSALAWAVVDKYPQLVEKHVCISGVHIATRRALVKSNFKQFLMSWYTFFFLCPFIPEFFMGINDLSEFEKVFRGPKRLKTEIPDDVIEGFKYYYSKPGAFTPPLNYYRSIFDFDSKPFSPKIQVPSLIIWGDEDQYLSKEIPEYMARNCKECKIEFIEGVGHFANQKRPVEVNKYIWRFLK